MPINPTILKKLLVTLSVVIGLFFGYQFVTENDETTEASTESTSTEQKYTDEDVSAFTDKQADDLIVDNQLGRKIQFNNSFAHTNPGVSSEIIVNAEGFEPGEFTIVYVRFAGTEEYIAAGGQELTADSAGKISTRFTITQFGDYEVFLSSDGQSFTSPTISVE